MPANIKKSLTVMIKSNGGNGVVNTRVKAAKKAECDEREYSITLKLPALGVAVFTCTPEETEKKPAAEHSQIKKSITKTRTVRKAAGKTKSSCKNRSETGDENSI